MKKFTDEQLRELIGKGLNQAEAARELCVSRSCVSRRMKSFRSKSTIDIVSANSFKEADGRLNIMNQLLAINQDATRLLNLLDEDSIDRVKVWREIRRQLDFQLKLFEVLYSIETARTFQQTVIEIIEEIDPGVRDQIISRLNEKSAIRRVLNPD